MILHLSVPRHISAHCTVPASMGNNTKTHWHSAIPSQLFVQATWKCSRGTWPIGVVQAHNTAQSNNTCDPTPQQKQTFAWLKVGILFWAEHAKDIVVFMDRFTIVPSLLLIPPVGVWVTKLSLLSWRIDIATILRLWSQLWKSMQKFRHACHLRIIDVGL